VDRTSLIPALSPKERGREFQRWVGATVQQMFIEPRAVVPSPGERVRLRADNLSI
jgi:hypothetical protein